jgi:DNA-binding CsgD family transcriptional regulator
LDRTKLTSEGRLLTGVLVGSAVIAVLAAVDLVFDRGEGMTVGHLLSEGAVFIAGLLGVLVMARRLRSLVGRARDARDEALALTERLKATEAEAARWRGEVQDLLDGLGAALDRQFERWALSPAEEEVALLLLKGLSHKDVADVRSITEATARQQARAIYKKSGLSGRSDLAAFFLEDLLLPISKAPTQPATSGRTRSPPAGR